MTTRRQDPFLDQAVSSVVGGEASGIETHNKVSRELSCPTFLSSNAFLEQSAHPHTERAFTISLTPKVKAIEESTAFIFAGWGVTTRANTSQERPIIRRVHTVVTAELHAEIVMITESKRLQLINRYTSAYSKWKKKKLLDAQSPGASDEKAQFTLKQARTQVVDSLIQLLQDKVHKLETTLGDVRVAPNGSVSGLAGTYRLCFQEKENKAEPNDEELLEQFDWSDPSSPTSVPLN